MFPISLVVVAAALSAAVTTTEQQETAPTLHGRTSPKERTSLFPAALRERGVWGERRFSQKKRLSPQNLPLLNFFVLDGKELHRCCRKENVRTFGSEEGSMEPKTTINNGEAVPGIRVWLHPHQGRAGGRKGRNAGGGHPRLGEPAGKRPVDVLHGGHHRRLAGLLCLAEKAGEGNNTVLPCIASRARASAP